MLYICLINVINLPGDMIDGMSTEQLADVIKSVSIVYRSTPRHKMKVIKVSGPPPPPPRSNSVL